MFAVYLRTELCMCCLWLDRTVNVTIQNVVLKINEYLSIINFRGD